MSSSPTGWSSLQPKAYSKGRNLRRPSTLTLWVMAAAICALATTTGRAQNGEWRSYAGDSGSRKDSLLDQSTSSSRSGGEKHPAEYAALSLP